MGNEQPMSSREKAVAVAKDVLKHVQTYHWSRGIYLSGTWWRGTPWTGDLRDHIKEVEDTCAMCLLGACLVSKARLFDDVAVNRLYNAYFVDSKLDYAFVNPSREVIGSLLRDIFSPLELAKIESAFERRVMDYDYGGDIPVDTHALLLGAAAFGRMFVDNADRVTAVMENIIANDGTFVVDPVTVAEYKTALCTQ